MHPRPVTEKDQIGMAAGKAIDSALAEFSHRFRQGRGPSLSAVDRIAAETLDDELEASMLHVSPEDREHQLREISGVLRAFRGSELMGLPRPKSRLILIDEAVGVYAQPDYWDGSTRFYEMKSYHADPIPQDVMLQLRLFQLAFPGFRALLAEFDRHSFPVSPAIREIAAPDIGDAREILCAALQFGRASGQDRVLEYVDNPVVRYESDPR